jgi:hypothetical protein
LKGAVNWFAVSAKVGGNVFYAIAINNISRNPRKFMKLMKRANS